MEDKLDEIKDALTELKELIIDLREEYSDDDVIDDFYDEAMDKISDLEDARDELESEAEDLQERLDEAEEENHENVVKYEVPTHTLEDEMKMELLHGLFDKYSLVELEKLRDGAPHALL